MRIYVRPEVLKENRRMFEGPWAKRPGPEVLGLPIVLESDHLNSVTHDYGHFLELHEQGRVVATVVYDISKVGGNASVWVEVPAGVVASISDDPKYVRGF